MKFILTFVLIVFSVALLLRLFENKFIYFPMKFPRGQWQPQAFGLQAEDRYFETPDGYRLHGWFFAKDQAKTTLLWCHGNAGNITDRLDNIAQLRNLAINIFIFDYRGYGRSQGTPSEKGIYLDAEAAYDYLTSRADVDQDNVVLFGRSLGGAVAVDLATKRPCAGLILESTFTSAKDMAKTSFGLIPVHWVMKTRLNAVRKIKSVYVPLLVLHGTSDSVVPFELGQKLFAAANEPKEFFEIQGADHNDTYVVGGPPYFNKLHAFVQDIQQRP